MTPARLTEPADAPREFARLVVERLRAANFRAYWAGGCVRDLILGTQPADYDVATDAPPSTVMQLFPRTVPVGISFGVVRVLGLRGAGEVEVATFRADGRYFDGRRPESVRFGSPEEDAQRRDFSINGMFMDPMSGEVIDHVGGRDDLNAGIIRAIGDPLERFGEDKLRLIRAIRFAARFDFAIDPETRRALNAMAPQVSIVAAERISQELRRMLVHPSRARGMELAAETGLLDAILPELASLRSAIVSPNVTAWDRTLGTLRSLGPGAVPSIPLALAALLHRAGEGSADSAMTPAVPAHSVAARSADAIARRLRLSNDERSRTVWLIENQAALWGVLDARPSSRKRMLAQPYIDDLMALHRAIAIADERGIGPLDALAAYRAKLPEGPIDPPPLVSGNDLAALGMRAGPRFKQMLERVRDAQLDGLIATRDEAIELIRSWLAE